MDSHRKVFETVDNDTSLPKATERDTHNLAKDASCLT